MRASASGGGAAGGLVLRAAALARSTPFLYILAVRTKRDEFDNLHATSVTDNTPLVGIIMGSRSDRETMQEAARVLDELGIAYEMEVVSAHRTPDRMFRYAEEAEGRGIRVIIAGAGGAAHLPGMTAAKTVLPVIGVPVLSSTLNGLDSLLSIVQMPKGVPVATVAIGKAGAANAGLLAARILGGGDGEIRARLTAYAARMAEDALRPEPQGAP